MMRRIWSECDVSFAVHLFAFLMQTCFWNNLVEICNFCYSSSSGYLANVIVVITKVFVSLFERFDSVLLTRKRTIPMAYYAWTPQTSRPAPSTRRQLEMAVLSSGSNIFQSLDGTKLTLAHVHEEWEYPSIPGPYPCASRESANPNLVKSRTERLRSQDLDAKAEKFWFRL